MAVTITSPRRSRPSDVSSDAQRQWVAQQAASFFASVEVLWEIDFHHQSTLPDRLIGEVITHVARCADDCADILFEFRTGSVAQIDRDRRWPEWPGGDRPGAVVMDDISTALRRIVDEVNHSAAGNGRSPGAARIPWDFLSEVVVHNWDLGIAVAELEPALADVLLDLLVAESQDNEEWPRIATERRGRTTSLVIAGPDDKAVRVQGSAEDLSRFITGRGPNHDLKIEAGKSLPELPQWTCYREFESI